MEIPSLRSHKGHIKEDLSLVNLAQMITDQLWFYVPGGQKTPGTSSFTTQSSRSSYH